jgi:hypothetical protein
MMFTVSDSTDLSMAENLRRLTLFVRLFGFPKTMEVILSALVAVKHHQKVARKVSRQALHSATTIFSAPRGRRASRTAEPE